MAWASHRAQPGDFVQRKIDLRLGPALATLDVLLARGGARKYDFAFIDADKSNYANYYERCIRLVRRGGLIAADNTLWYGRVADPRDREPDTPFIRTFNRKSSCAMRAWTCRW